MKLIIKYPDAKKEVIGEFTDSEEAWSQLQTVAFNLREEQIKKFPHGDTRIYWKPRFFARVVTDDLKKETYIITIE